MIDLYYWTTPNGHKITIFLEEAALPYRIVPVDISKGEQFKPDFLAISPNNRMPAIVDHNPKDGRDPISVFESGAILVYLAEKTGRYLPNGFRDRVEVMEWLFWQMAGLGPEPSLRALCAGEAALRDRALRQGDEPLVRRAQQAAVGS
jgi:GST-like protein